MLKSAIKYSLLNLIIPPDGTALIGGDPEIILVVFTGVGEYYSARNGLKPNGNIDDIDAYIRESNEIFINMMKAFIECTKVIVLLVNGPCIGVAATLAGLSDVVWCSEKVCISLK